MEQTKQELKEKVRTRFKDKFDSDYFELKRVYDIVDLEEDRDDDEHNSLQFKFDVEMESFNHLRLHKLERLQVFDFEPTSNTTVTCKVVDNSGLWREE